MSITNLTNTKWVINNTPSITGSKNYSINFESAGNRFTKFELKKGLYVSSYNYIYYNTTLVCTREGTTGKATWSSSAYKTIIIIGGTDVTNSNLISWLESNATQDTSYPPIGDITFWYKDICYGATSVSGTKTLDTAGTWLEDDIEVKYTKTLGSATTPTTTITANPTISVSSTGLITASVSGTQSVTPTVSAGYISTGTAGTVSVSGSNTSQLTTQGATTITPTEQSQTAVASGTYTTGAITVDPIPSQYIVPTGTISITSNGTVDVSQYASASVNVSGGTITEDGHGGIELGDTGSVTVIKAPNDVNFIDYDGTIVASYSASDFANLSAMPDNPTHTGLTAQGWNWTLADAKAQVAVSGQLVIGQMYVTSDGKTRIYLSIPSTLLCEVRLYIGQTVGRAVQIDWGDGSDIETLSGTGTKSGYHTYASVGDYCITLNPTSGTLTLGGGSTTSTIIVGRNGIQAFKNLVTKIEIGNNVALANAAFYALNSLEVLTIPKEITSFGNSIFYSLYSLKSVTIPINTSTIGSTNFARYSYGLRWLSIPKTLTTFTAYAFGSCLQLRIIVVPIGTTTIPEGLYQSITSAAKVVIPSTVTSIDTKAFNACNGLQEIHFKPTTPPTCANENAFTNVPTTCKIYVPSGSLSAYTSASNYPDSTTYTYVEE